MIMRLMYRGLLKHTNKHICLLNTITDSSQYVHTHTQALHVMWHTRCVKEGNQFISDKYIVTMCGKVICAPTHLSHNPLSPLTVTLLEGNCF